MKLKKNLVISIDEDSPAGEKDVISFRTTVNGKLVVEVAGPKLVLNPLAVQAALNEVQAFIAEQGYSSTETQPSPLIIHGDDV